jgi:hypothetical protein
MSAAFLFFSSVDHALASEIIDALSDLGINLSWDVDTAGAEGRQDLERQIDSLAAVVVLWTPTSVSSHAAGEAARTGQRKGKLVNLLAGVDSPPSPFDRCSALVLDAWQGERHEAWVRLAQMIKSQGAPASAEIAHSDLAEQDLALAPADAGADSYRPLLTEAEALAAAAPLVTSAASAAQEQLRRIVDMQGSATLMRAAQAELDAVFAEREEGDRARSSAAASLAATQEAFQAAKVDEWKTLALLAAAGTSVSAAQEQLRRVVDMRGSAALTRAAQAELESAIADRESAGRGRRVALESLAEAYREFARAKSQLEQLLGELPTTAHVDQSEDTLLLPFNDRVADPLAAGVPADSVALAAHPGAEAVLSAPGAPALPSSVAHSGSRKKSRNIAWTAAVVFGAVAVLLAGLAWLLVRPHTGTSNRHSPAPVTAASPPRNTTDPRLTALSGAWAGNGADCVSSPLKIDVLNNAQIALTLLDKTTKGRVDAVDASGAIRTTWQDGVWTYKILNGALEMTPPQGPSMAYARCVG